MIALASIAVALLNLGTPMTLIPFQSQAIDLICLGVSCVIAAIILAFAFKYRNVAAAVLAVVQILLALVFEFVFAPQVEVIYGLYTRPPFRCSWRSSSASSARAYACTHSDT